MRFSQPKVESLKKKALEILVEKELPPSVHTVARELNISWTTARQILMELAVQGKIVAHKTEKSWIFEVIEGCYEKEDEKK